MIGPHERKCVWHPDSSIQGHLASCLRKGPSGIRPGLERLTRNSLKMAARRFLAPRALQNPVQLMQREWEAGADRGSGTDPALRLLGEVWDELPDAVKNRILRLANQSIDTPSS